MGNEQQHRKLPAQVAETPVEFTLVGSCFNATFAVRKHLERCPWCPDRNLHVSLSGTDFPEQTQSDGGITSLMADDRIFYSFITLCIAFIVLVAAITICLCQLPCCSRKRLQRTKSDKNLAKNLYHQRALPPNHFHPMHQTLLKNRQQHDEDEHHYQMPMIPSDVVEHRLVSNVFDKIFASSKKFDEYLFLFFLLAATHFSLDKHLLNIFHFYSY